MGRKEYQKTKSMYYIFDPLTGEYYQGKENGVVLYTKDKWNAQAYKILSRAIAMMNSLGTGFIVVDGNGKRFEQ